MAPSLVERPVTLGDTLIATLLWKELSFMVNLSGRSMVLSGSTQHDRSPADAAAPSQRRALEPEHSYLGGHSSSISHMETVGKRESRGKEHSFSWPHTWVGCNSPRRQERAGWCSGWGHNS